MSTVSLGLTCMPSQWSFPSPGIVLVPVHIPALSLGAEVYFFSLFQIPSYKGIHQCPKALHFSQQNMVLFCKRTEEEESRWSILLLLLWLLYYPSSSTHRKFSLCGWWGSGRKIHTRKTGSPISMPPTPPHPHPRLHFFSPVHTWPPQINNHFSWTLSIGVWLRHALVSTRTLPPSARERCLPLSRFWTSSLACNFSTQWVQEK